RPDGRGDEIGHHRGGVGEMHPGPGLLEPEVAEGPAIFGGHRAAAVQSNHHPGKRPLIGARVRERPHAYSFAGRPVHGSRLAPIRAHGVRLIGAAGEEEGERDEVPGPTHGPESTDWKCQCERSTCWDGFFSSPARSVPSRYAW